MVAFFRLVQRMLFMNDFPLRSHVLLTAIQEKQQEACSYTSTDWVVVKLALAALLSLFLSLVVLVKPVGSSEKKLSRNLQWSRMNIGYRHLSSPG